MRLVNRYSPSKFLIIFFLCLLIQNIQAQEKYFFEQLSVSDGLSNSVVLCSYQDRLGYLWIGTMDGLNRYDGYDIKVYKNIPGDSTSIPYNTVFSIGEDGDGHLLVGSNEYVSRYNRELDNFENFNIEKGGQFNFSKVLNFLKDSKERLWISTSYTGIQIFDKSANAFRRINIRGYSGKRNTFFQFPSLAWPIIELKNGQIITATQNNGICIYNDIEDEFQPYFSNPKSNLENIEVIFEDSSGKIWFAGKDDIHIYNPSNYDFKRLNIASRLPKRPEMIQYCNIYEEESKKVFIGSGLGIIETDTKANNIALITDNIPNINPNHFYRDNFGIYWISSGGKGLFRFDPSKKPFQFFDIIVDGQSETNKNPVSSIAQNPDNENELLVSLNNHGIFTFYRNSKKFQKKNNQAGANLLPDDRGNVWYTTVEAIDPLAMVGTTGSENVLVETLNVLNLKSGKTESMVLPNQDFTRGYFVSNMKFGPDKNIWIADRQGVQTYDRETRTLSRIPSITNKPVNPALLANIKDVVNKKKPLASILRVGEAALLSQVFNLASTTKMLIVSLGEGRPNSQLITMYDYGWLEDAQGKRLWAADKIENTFYDGGGFKNRIAFGCLDLPAGEYNLNYLTDIGHNYGAFNVAAPPDSQWYGIQALKLDEQQYLYFTETLSKEYDNASYPPFEWVNDITFSRKYINTAWIAPLGAGLIKLNVKDYTYQQYSFDDSTQRIPLVNRLINILEDKDGLLWIVSQGGLISFNPETEVFDLINQNDGLASDQVFFMVEDKNGNIWFGTPNGISMLDKNNSDLQWSFINYDNTDGINDLPLNESMAITDDGEIFYGGFGGVNAFYPGSANSSLARPIITQLSISGVPINKLASKFDLKTNISETRQLTLPFSDNNLSLEFASIHFSRPEKNKLAYMMEGIDRDWHYTQRRFASYLNLPSGEYIFRLKGSNGDGIWNPEEKTLKIIITPPWWRTTFAYIGYVLLFLGLIFSIDRIQRARVKAQEKRKAEMTILEAENKRKSEELEEARQLQLSMLPKQLPQLPNLDIAVYMQTATEVGGDYYDFHVSLDGTLTVVIGDATGHGMKAGTMVTTVKSLFNSYAPNPDILFSFKEISRCIKQMNFGKLSMCLTMLKIKGDKMQISTAGMPPSFIFRSDTRVVEEHLFKAMPLGTMMKFPYEIKDTTLKPGDTILLMSDGLPELENDNKEMYGYKKIRNGFEDVAEKTPEEIITHFKNEGSNWVNDEAPDDDVTFVIIKVK